MLLFVTDGDHFRNKQLVKMEMIHDHEILSTNVYIYNMASAQLILTEHHGKVWASIVRARGPGGLFDSVSSMYERELHTFFDSIENNFIAKSQ